MPANNFKVCGKCKEYKPQPAFCKDGTASDGFDWACKACRKSYRQSPEGKTAKSRYESSEKGKAVKSRYKTCYRQTKEGKSSNRRTSARERLLYPNHVRARRVVCIAIRAGRLTPAIMFQCSYCGKAAQQYHHWHGYAKEHWLDVIPACRKCDVALHKSKQIV